MNRTQLRVDTELGNKQPITQRVLEQKRRQLLLHGMKFFYDTESPKHGIMVIEPFSPQLKDDTFVAIERGMTVPDPVHIVTVEETNDKEPKIEMNWRTDEKSGVTFETVYIPERLALEKISDKDFAHLRVEDHKKFESKILVDVQAEATIDDKDIQIFYSTNPPPKEMCQILSKLEEDQVESESKNSEVSMYG